MAHFQSRLPPRPSGGRITTPAGSTIEASPEGGYRICDRQHHCRQVGDLWAAQQLVQWAEVHHQALDSPDLPLL